MTNPSTVSKIVSVVLALYLLIPILSICVKAFDDFVYEKPSADDLWNVARDLNSSFFLYEYLSDEGMIARGVTFGEFDYICVLTQQLCTMTKNVEPELALAMIAVESNFDKDCKTGRARGLMQLIPIYQSKRMELFVEKGHQIDLDDFFNPRLNIMTGLDYMDYILYETNGDVNYALMWYNQGPTSASRDYLDKFHISSYAKKVTSLSTHIKTFLGEEVYGCS